jgi:hypothetical protein
MEDLADQYTKLKEELDNKDSIKRYIRLKNEMDSIKIEDILTQEEIVEDAEEIIEEEEIIEKFTDKEPIKKYIQIKLELDAIKKENRIRAEEDKKQREEKTLGQMEFLFSSLKEEEKQVVKELEITEEVINGKVEEKPFPSYESVVNVISKQESIKDKTELQEQPVDSVSDRIDKLEKSIRKIIFAEHGGGLDPNKISASLIPTTTNTYSLGSSTRTWKDLHLSGSTLIIGDTSLASSELTVLDGVTLGTVSANKAVIVDANKDITGFRNVNAASYSIGGTAITSTSAELNLLNGVSGLVQADFTKLAAVTSSAVELNLLDGVSGLVQSDLTKLAAINATAAEINLIDGGTSRGTTAVVSGDGILINDEGTMRMTNVDTISTYFASHSVGGGNMVTTGALDSGSITSGFGTIDTGSSNITTTGTVSAGNLTVSGTTTTVNSTVMTVVDPIIHLQTASGGGALGSDTNKDVGLALQYHTGSAAKTAFLGFDDSAGKLTFIPDATLSSEVVSGTAGTIVAALEGNASTATTLATARTIGGTSFDGSTNIAVALSATTTALATARTIGGVSFDGTANINLPGVNASGTQDTSGNADTATALATGRTIGMTGDVVWTSASFTGSGNVTGSATIQAGSVENSMLADDAVGADELAANAVVNASVAAGAAISLSKIATTTVNRVLETSGTGVISASAITTTELALLDGSSSGSIVNSKAVIYSGTGTIAGTLSTVAQGNVTSLGTLTSLTIDNVLINGSTIGHTGDTDLMTLSSGILTVAGEVSMTTLDIGGTNVTSTAAELNRLDGIGSAVVGLSDTQTLTNKTLTSPVFDTDVSGTAVLDEDSMESNSSTKIATQQSIKAYIEATSTAMSIALG